MKKLLLSFFIILFAFTSNAVWSDDFNKGKDAFDIGDYETALREWTPLAEQGYVAAQYNLGVMFRNGYGVPVDYKTAVRWYRLAAEQGYDIAQSNLGFMYYKGYGVPVDYKTAVRWYRLAVEQEFYIAQNNLGLMYEKGYGVPEDYKTAVKWYRLAAEQGYDLAQSNLGFMYYKGYGVPEDYKTAVRWYRLAAEQGYADAQYSLGLMYVEQGIFQSLLALIFDDEQGVLQDNVYAHMWANIAATQGNDKGSKLRDELEEKMTSDDISKAQTLARECVAKNYKGC